MSIIRDTDGTIYAKINDSMARNPLSISSIEKGSFTPCRFGQDVEFLNVTCCDDEGNLQINNERVASLSYYDLEALEMAKEFESALNRLAEISLYLAHYSSCWTGLMGIELMSGVEEIQKTVNAVSERIFEIFPEGRQMQLDDEPT
jgi:hypothetical protein